MRTFQFKHAKSSKFWNIDVRGHTLTVTFGKIGSAGRASKKTFPTAEKARAAAEKLIKEKTKKGYAETPGARRSTCGTGASPTRAPARWPTAPTCGTWSTSTCRATR